MFAAWILALLASVVARSASPALFASVLTRSATIALALTRSASNALTLEDPPDRRPDATAKPLTAFSWKSKNDLRFVWWLPKDYDASKPRNLTVICHGTGLDYRWGFWNNKPGVFRPDDIVVSVDGPTPDGKSRLFLGQKHDADAIAAFLAEMRQLFAVDRIFLYGHSQGSFFVVFFAGEHPEQVAGVVAHASGAWLGSKMAGDVKHVPIAFMHGTSDPVVPYGQSPGARDAYLKAGLTLVHLRRLDRYSHWPNAVRANECLAWCQGMSAKSAEEALACAREILRPKPADEYQWTTIVGFSAARDVLRRIEKKGPAPFVDVPDEVAKKAAELAKKIDEAGKEQVDDVRKQVKSKADLQTTGPWMGQLIPMREDYRGVESVEAFMKEIDFDAAQHAQDKVAESICNTWYQQKDPKKIYDAVVENIGKAILFDGYPAEFAKKMDEWNKDAKKLGLSVATTKKYAAFEAWKKGWDDGLKEYEAVWKNWKEP